MQNSEFKNWLTTIREQYLTSKTFIEESKNDPPQEPYKSKYKAKEILSTLLMELEKQWEVKDEMQIAAVWALFKYDLGIIALETEEYSTGCDCLTDCWEVLEKFSLQPECCILSLSILNQLGILWSGRGEPSKALNFLKEAEKIYDSYKDICTISPFSIEGMFQVDIIPEENWKSFEKVFTLTLYYLAQVYEHLNESDKSAKYCHMTLKRQREYEYEEKEWSVNCATLSQYYIQEKKFLIGRHLLACSTCTLTKYEASIDNKVDDEDVWDDIHRSKAEVAWCWVKYCINLLLECQNVSEGIKKQDEKLDVSFQLSDEESLCEIESNIPFHVFTFEEARKVFVYGQSQIKEAKLYYTLSDHANNHVQLIQDYSKLYKYLIFYEIDLGRQCKMHKRRIDILEDALSKMNPQYYLAVCRQLRFEIGETYYELIDLKLKIVNSSNEGMVLSSVKKINSLTLRCMDQFRGFIDTLKDREGVVPKVYTDDLARPVLIAHFYLARLYMKLIESDTSKKLYNLSQSEEHYKFIFNYSEKNPDHAHYIDQELPVVKEMIELMPERIMQITGSTLF